VPKFSLEWRWSKARDGGSDAKGNWHMGGKPIGQGVEWHTVG